MMIFMDRRGTIGSANHQPRLHPEGIAALGRSRKLAATLLDRSSSRRRRLRLNLNAAAHGCDLHAARRAGADRRQIAWVEFALSPDPGTGAIPSRAIEAGMNTMQYWFQLVQDLRAHRNDGLISGLFDVELEDDEGGGTRLSDGEIVGFCSLLGAAGSETTTRLLGFAALLFAQHPEQYAKILADPGRIADAVEEVLRWSSPAQYAVRSVGRDVEVVRPDRAGRSRICSWPGRQS